MTAYTDTMMQNAAAERAHMLDGGRMLGRLAQRVAGVALLLAAAMMWLAPGAVAAPEAMLAQLGLSLALGFAGLALLQGAQVNRSPEVEIDTIRREVRLVRAGADSPVISRTPFAQLGHAESRGATVRLWAADGTLIAEVAPAEPAVLKRLKGALRDAGKL